MFWNRSSRIVHVRIHANVEWAFAQDPDSNEWIGICRELNLNAIGDTFAEVQQGASEAMDLLFRDLFRDGQLEAFLRQRGWTVQSQTTLPKAGSAPRFDTSYVSRIAARARDLVPAHA